MQTWITRVRASGSRIFALLAALLFCLASFPALSLAGDRSSRKPNFVLFVIDDLDTASLASMPAVDRWLTRDGLSFTRFFATTPLCCPSRASLLRGQYAHNHGVLRNTGDNAGFSAFRESGNEQVTLATQLDEAGYETALLGKYLNGYSLPGNRRAYIPPGWDFWVAGVDHSAYSNFNYELNDNGTLSRHGDSPSDYLTDVIADRADAFLDDVTRSRQPFMLYVAPYAPHSPATPAPRHEGQFSAATAPRTKAFNEQNVRDKPRWVRRAPRISPARKARVDEGYAQRLEALQAVDELVDSVMQRLADSGALQNTYVLFLSDNGYFLGEHRQPHGKDAPYDAASRVPLIARGPGISSGATTAAIALNIDILPTLLSLAGGAIPAFVDGRSLQPLFNGDPGDWRRTALLEGFGKETESTDTGEQPTPAFRALRTERVLYVEYDTGERELYDLRKDPHQVSNVVKKSSKALRRIYSRRLEELSTCTGDSCRAAEDAPLANRRRDLDHTRRASDGKRGRHDHHRDTRRERRR